MGCGKTEAALVMAETFAQKTGRTGVFFALPTQATSNAMFDRLLRWTAALELNGAESIKLAHGKAQMNEDYHRLFEGGKNVGTDEEDSAQPYKWFEGNRKALLADFVVGTIDQLLLAALRQKYVMLRHLGLANKVVIIDECHAYDAYMSRYLQKALRWLGAYGVPVIVLSATLTGERRKLVIEAYRGKPAIQSVPNNPLVPKTVLPPAIPPKWVTSRGYPLLTYTDGDRADCLPIDDRAATLEVVVERIGDNALLSRLDTLLAEGGYAGIIVNTVKRAQETTRLLKTHFGEDAVTLLHSRFLAPDRTRKEKELLEKVGNKSDALARADHYIIVGTQVMEQSLDIDFDLLISDLCPMDFLLQRIGRLHRHNRARPPALQQARCLVIGLQEDCLDEGAKAVYGEYLLMRTRAFLPERIVLPADIPTLVENAYDRNTAIHPEPEGYTQAKLAWEKRTDDKEQKADVFRISDPSQNPDTTLTGWLDTAVGASEKGGEAAVRDGDESFEVLALWQCVDRIPRFLPWIENGRAVPIDVVPDNDTARLLACQSLRLPHELCYPWVIEKTIQTLEHRNAALSRWQESPWLKGELFMLLDENFSLPLNGYRLIYDREIGLTCEKEDTTHAG